MVKVGIIGVGGISRKHIYELLENYKDKTVVVFKNREEADGYIKEVR